MIVGQTRERVHEFVYDYSYLSLDPTDVNYTSQEQVFRISHTGGMCSVLHVQAAPFNSSAWACH